MRMRQEHGHNTLQMGRTAARNMGRASEPYTQVPMFYSDMYEMRYEALRELNRGR